MSLEWDRSLKVWGRAAIYTNEWTRAIMIFPFFQHFNIPAKLSEEAVLSNQFSLRAALQARDRERMRRSLGLSHYDILLVTAWLCYDVWPGLTNARTRNFGVVECIFVSTYWLWLYFDFIKNGTISPIKYIYKNIN